MQFTLPSELARGQRYVLQLARGARYHPLAGGVRSTISAPISGLFPFEIPVVRRTHDALLVSSACDG